MDKTVDIQYLTDQKDLDHAVKAFPSLWDLSDRG